MKKGTLLIGVVALMLFFVVAGLVRSFFQFPEDKVKYDLLCVRVEGSSENICLSFDLSLFACPHRQPISHGLAFHTNLHVRIQIKYIAGFFFHNNSPK